LAPLAVATAVRRVGEIPAQVKWPNDVLVEDRKLAGILLERVDTSDGPAAVVGIGLNVTLRAAERPQPLATSMALEGAATTDRVIVLAAVLRELATRYQAWVDAKGDPEAILPDYRELSATFGRDVRVELPDGTSVEGTATGLDSDGRLLVQTPTGPHPLAAGDVTHLHPA
jgi:BirA family transcriptional regulator, biotin operon repressor / biotin---[acetyl-CoA-carboxylase] ligase